MTQIAQLYRLQQVDSQISQVDAQIAALDRLLAGDEAVLAAQAATDTAVKEVRRTSHALLEAEAAVKTQRTKIEQNEATLYGGKVKSPKELQDLQKDIAILRKRLSELEDHQLEAMIAVEAAQQSETEARASLALAQAAFAERGAGWNGERAALIKQRERMMADRSGAVAQVQPAMLARYDALRARKSGIAVTLVKDGVCSVCGGTVRPAEAQEARAAVDLVPCASCGRILYAG